MLIHPICPYCNKVIDINVKTIDTLQQRITYLESLLDIGNKDTNEMPEFMKSIFGNKGK